MKVIIGVPLSVYKPVEGVYMRFDERKNLEGYIIGNKEQDPRILLYKPLAILVERGGILTHLATVCRERGIPLFRIKNLDDLVDGERIRVVPVSRDNVRVSDRAMYILRIIDDKEDSRGYIKTLSAAKYVERRYGLKIRVIGTKKKRENVMHIKLAVLGYRALLENMLRDPGYYIRLVKEDIENTAKLGVPIGLYLIQVGESLIGVLANKYGYERVLDAIPPFRTVWNYVDNKYFKIRFSIEDESVINEIRELSKESKRKYTPLPGKDNDILMLALMIFKLYEAKNVVG